MLESKPRSVFWATFCGLSGLAALPIWWVEWLPLVDLPQHEAMVSILTRWNDPACGYPEVFELRALTPYWLAYGVAWALAHVVGVAAAWKLVVTSVVIAIPLAARGLVSDFGGDERWVLILFPFGFGFATSWGFASFLLAVPLVLLVLRTAFRHVAAPGLRSGLALAVGANLLVVAHALAWALVAGLCVALALVAGRGLAPAARRAAPLLLSLPLPLAWAWLSSRAAPGETSRAVYLLGFDRVTDLPVLLSGIPHRPLAWAALIAALASLVLAGARPSRDPVRWTPAVLLAAIVLLGPNLAFGTAYLAPRFAILLMPALLCALDRAPSMAPARTAPLLAVAVALLLVVAWRYDRIDREGEGLREVLAAAPAGERLLYLAFDRGSRYSDEDVFLHSGSRYAIDRCGISEASFGRSFASPVRFRDGEVNLLPRHVEFMPQLFRWAKHGGARFGLLLVRARREPDPEALAGGPGRLALLAHRGRWWLYENLASDG